MKSTNITTKNTWTRTPNQTTLHHQTKNNPTNTLTQKQDNKQTRIPKNTPRNMTHKGYTRNLTTKHTWMRTPNQTATPYQTRSIPSTTMTQKQNNKQTRKLTTTPHNMTHKESMKYPKQTNTLTHKLILTHIPKHIQPTITTKTQHQTIHCNNRQINKQTNSQKCIQT